MATPDTQQGVASGSRFWQVLLILMALETGLFLLLVPWLPVWERNLLPGYFAPIASLLRNYFMRGAIGGLGLVNLWIGLTEAILLSRRGSPPSTARD